MASANDKLYRTADGYAWVGEHWVGRYPSTAVATADLPPAEDPRWTPGAPHEPDVQFLTLSPFYPTGRLGVTVERKSSAPLFPNGNHPPFFGCKAWMRLDQVNWAPVPKAAQLLT